MKKAAPLIAGILLLFLAALYLSFRPQKRVDSEPGPDRVPKPSVPSTAESVGERDAATLLPEPSLEPEPPPDSVTQDSSTPGDGDTSDPDTAHRDSPQLSITDCKVLIESLEIQGKTAFRVSTQFTNANAPGQASLLRAPTMAVEADQQGTLAIRSDDGKTHFEANIKVSPRENGMVWLDLDVMEMKNDQIIRSTQRAGLLRLGTPHVFE